MGDLLTKINLVYLLLKAKEPIAAFPHRNTSGRVMGHYNMTNTELLKRLKGN